MARSCKVAVIGAGMSGLVAANELLQEGHRVVVFEKSHRVGGTWVYDPRVDSDPLGVDPNRTAVRGSLYQSLRTNLPRPLMGFIGYPFPEPNRSHGDHRMFPGHEEVLAFLEAFAAKSGVIDSVRFGAEVVRVEMGRRKDEWVVRWRTETDQGIEADAVELFEAVVVCNGHHSEPRIAEIPGISRWPGKQIHSHNYRTPEPFKDQVVVIIGMGASAYDLSTEISKVAKEVHQASRSTNPELGKLSGHENIWRRLMIKRVYEDCGVEFDDGSLIHADVILHCTGYKYHFPFLETNGIVSVDDNRVGPLYENIFPPCLAPWLAFVGLPNKTIVFLTSELQSKWIAQVLSKKLELPSEEDMTMSVHKFYEQLEDIGRPKHLTHNLHPNQAEYLNWLLSEVGLPHLEEWRVQMYQSALMSLISHEDDYRETWEVNNQI